MATNIRPVKPTPTEHLSEPIINSNRANISANQDTAELPNTKLISGDLSGVDPFEEDNSTRIGTPEFQQKYQGFMQSQDGNNLLGVFDGAVALKAKWQARHTGLPSGESQEEISSNPANFLHPYADFLSSFGGDRMSITAGIARAQSRAAFYADRYSNDPRTKLLLDASTGGDPSLLNNSKAFGQALVKAGVIQSQEEYDFWQKTDGKYHRGYNMSPYVYLKKQFDPENKAPNHIASLKEDLLESGYRLDPDKPEDVDKFIAYRKYIDENSNDYISNAGQMVVGLAGNLQKTIAGNVIALIDPQIDWSPEYKEASGARLEKKQNFLRILAELKNLERTHSSEEAIGLDAKIDLLNRTKGAESFDDFDFDKIDPTTESTKIPEIMLRLNAAYDELDSDGAFYKDIRGITGICQFVSTVLAGLYSMSGFLYSSDPNAWSAKLHSELQDWYAKITTSNKTANGRTFINEADRDNYLLNYGAINQFNSALDLDHDIQKRVQYGILPDVGSRVLDSRFHADQVAIVDPFRGAGKILKLSKALTKNVGIFEKYYQAAETKKMLLALSRVEQIADRGIKFDVAKGLQGDIKLQWTAAKTELEKAAGKPLSDAEVIKGIQTGKVKIPDIKDPTKLVDFPAEGLNQIYDHVSNMSKDVESLRKNLIKIVKNGQKIEYSANSYDTLNLAREMLKKAAPEVDWDKTSDFEIFQRIKEGKIPYSDVEFTPKGTKAVIKTTSGTWAQRTQNLKKEVGETWRKISVNDAAGFKRANSLPIELIYGAGTTGASWALRKGSYGLRSWADSIDSNLSKNIDPSVARVATDTLRDKNGTYIATVASEASKGATQQTIAKAGMLTTFMRGIAVGFDAGEFVSDFIAADGRVSMYGSTFLGMYGEYARKLRELADKKSKIEGIAAKLEEEEALRKAGRPFKPTVLTDEETKVHSTYVNAKEEIAKIEIEAANLRSKQAMTKYLHMAGANGLLSVTRPVLSAGKSAIINEGIGLIGNSNLGYGSGGAFFFHGLNSAVDGVSSNFSRRTSIQERTNRDLYELHSRMFTMNESQQKNFLEVLVEQRKKADKLGLERTQEVGDQYFARTVSSMLYLLKTSNFEIRDGGVAKGMMKVLQGTQHLDPTYQAELRQKFISEAESKGLTGKEAMDYADQLLDASVEHTLSGIRIGKIDEELGALDKEKESQLRKTNTILYQYEQSLRIAMESAGIHVKSLSIDEAGNITMNGKPLENLDSKTQRKIQVLHSNYQNVRAKRIAGNAVVETINRKMAILNAEKLDLQQNKRTSDYREGEVVANTTTGETAQTWGGGVTIWEKDGRRTVVLDKNYDIGDAFEELNHALFYTEGMQAIRPQIESALFGRWEVNQNREFVMVEKPLVSMEQIDSFVEAYTKGLSPNDASMFKAEYEIGKKLWESNKNDKRYLQKTVMEIFAAMFKGRMQMLDPHQGRTEQFGSSYRGSIEMSPIQAGKSKTEIFGKLVFGSLTPLEWARHTTGIETGANLAELNRLTPEDRVKFTDALQAGARFIATFGVQGTFDLMFKKNRIQALRDMGMMPRGNQSSDPQRFWNTAQLYNYETGQMSDIHPNFTRIIDSAVNITRNVIENPDMEAIRDFQSVFNNASQSDEPTVNQRIAWAFATGRKGWLEVGPDGKWTGMFKGDIASLLLKEREPINRFFGRLLKGKPEDMNDLSFPKDFYGFTVTNSLIDPRSKIAIGQPDKRQVREIVDYLRTKQSQLSLGNIQEVEAIYHLLNAIADNNHFDPEANNPGLTQIFCFEYTGDEYNISPITKEKRKVVKGRLRTMTPIQAFIEESPVAFDGTRYPESQKRATMYFWCIDEEQRIGRIRAAYKGQLVDVNGVKYWSPEKIKSVFDSEKNFAECVDLVLQNYSNSGSPVKSNPNYKLPPRSWEVLLPKAGGDEILAMHMADIVNRTIGFPGKNYFEYSALLRKLDEEGLTDTEKSRLDELRDRGFKMKPGDKALGDLQETPNQIGDRPIWSSNMIFTKIRADRITSPLVHYQDGAGRSYTPWSSGTWGLGDINYSAQTWKPLDIRNTAFPQVGQMELAIKKFGDKLDQPLVVTGGILHQNTGMHIIQAQRGKDTVFMIFDNKNKLVVHSYQNLKGGTEKINSFDTAIKAAEDYANSKPQNPVNKNALEMNLHDYGFSPIGSTFAGGIRTVFVSHDGKYVLSRASGGRLSGSFNLIDNRSGVVLVDNVKIGYGPDRKTPNLDNLVAAVIMAEEGNYVNFKIEENRIKDLTQEKVNGLGLAEWAPIIGPDGKKINNGKLFAANNPVYYEFKRRLINSTGHANALKILKLMRQELGDQVIENDYSPVSATDPNQTRGTATIQWIRDYCSAHHWDLQKMHEEIFRDIARDEAESRASQLIIDTANAGKPIPAHKPMSEGKPVKTTGEPVTVTTRGENGDLNVDTKEAYDIRTAEYAKEIQQARDNGLFGDNTEQNAREELVKLLEWAQTLQKLQSNFEEQARNTSTAFTANTGEAIIAKLNELKGDVRFLKTMHTNGLWASKSGYIIQSMMYPEKSPMFGTKVTVNRLGVYSGAKLAYKGLSKLLPNDEALKTLGNLDLYKTVTGKESEPSVFYIFSPKGNLVGTAVSLQDAQTQAAKYADEVQSGKRKDGAVIQKAFRKSGSK